MQRNRILALLSAAVAICILGIAIGTIIEDNAAFQTVEASIQSVNLSEIGTTSCEITLTVLIINPSDRSINGLSSDFDLFIQNVSIGHGSSSETNLPANSQNIDQLSLNLSYTGLATGTVQIIKNLIGGQQTSLILDGEIHARLLWGLVPVHQEFLSAYP